MRNIVILSICAILAACGGGGGGGTASTSNNTNITTAVLLDSFGLPVGTNDGFGGADSSGDSGADGTAGDGAPIPNALVTVQDASGKTATATTNSKGYYRVKITGFTGPLVANVTKADGTKRYSLIVQSPVPGKFITMNLSGLTDKIASDVAIAGGKTKSSELTPALVAANAKVIDSSIAAMRVTLASAIQNAGLEAATFDPLRTPFVADHTGYDKVLDNTVITYSVSGATQIAPATVIAPPATGTSASGSSLTVGTKYNVWSPSNFASSTLLAPTISISGATASIAFGTLNVTVSTVDNWVNSNWSGVFGNNNAQRADGNVLRFCSANTDIGTSIAISEKLTEVTDRSVIYGKTFAIQDCSVSNSGALRTVTFNSDGSITSSNGNTLPASQVAANFSASGFVEGGNTSYATLYSFTYANGQRAYFLLSRLSEPTRKYVQIGVVVQ